MPPAGPQSSKPSSSESDWYMPDYVALLLAHSDGSHVLMNKHDGVWTLPQFTYPNSINYDVNRCCTDLQRSLSIEAPGVTVFSASIDLFGEYASSGFQPEDDVGFARLFMLESHVPISQLPDHFEWKDAEFLSSSLEALDPKNEQSDFLTHALRHINPRAQDDSFLRIGARYAPGWFSKASAWLRSIVSSANAAPSGRVVQVRVSPSSTILKIDSTSGWFYLKSPTLGSNEVSITSALASIFPKRCVEVIATSELLHSFVTPGLQIDDLDDNEHTLPAVRIIGEIQLASVTHVDKLLTAGCPDHTPARLKQVLLSWAESAIMKRIFVDISPYLSLLPHLVALCEQLERSKIPITIVHGDFALRNLAFRRPGEQELQIFDWQYACISHPFCDMHEVDDLRPGDDDESLISVREKVREEYLSMFAEHVEDESELREEYNAARIIGKVLQMWTSMECIGDLNVYIRPPLDEFVFDCFVKARARMRDQGIIEEVKKT